MDLGNRLTVDITVASEAVTVHITDRRPDIVTLFGGVPDKQAKEFATEAWAVGLRALMNANTLAQEARLEDIGKQFQENFVSHLQKFFDPVDGQFPKSLADFVDDKGDLSQRLTKHGDDLIKTFVQNLDPRIEDSAVALFLKEVKALMTNQASTHTEALDRLRDDITRLETKRSEAQKTPRGGLEFEAAVLDFATEAVRSGPWLVEDTSNKTGHVPYSKVGDSIVEATQDSVFAGARVVIEAKRDGRYTEVQALKELDVARANRKADVGLFVMAASHAPQGFPRSRRVGRNVLVIWDHEDPLTDPYLEAALWLALSLVPLSNRLGTDGDVKALADIQGRMEAELNRLTTMEGYNTAIRKNSDSLADEIRKCRDQFGALLSKVKATLIALNVELLDEAAERHTPIELSVDFLERVVAPPAANGEATPGTGDAA